MFDGINIPRVEAGFVAQIERHTRRQPELSTEQEKLVKLLPGEFSSIKHRRGHLSMARYDDPNSADTSFSFMLGDAEHLDGRYTIFGTVTEGLDVLTAIEDLPVDRDKAPETRVTIQRTTLVRDGNLAGLKLQSAIQPVTPDAPYQTFFKYFAAFAFFITVLLPIAKTACTELGPRRA